MGAGNGIVDLKTGKLRAGRPDDRISVATPIIFDPDARCPRFEQFLAEVFAGDGEMTNFIQKSVGYCLTGYTSEQCLFLCYGTGANGKTTFLNVIGYVMGNYSYNLPFSAFELRGRSAISNDIAALRGKRFVTAVETSESAQLNAERIKGLTGSDPITARFLYREFSQFEPTAKFWLAFNHRPRVEDDSFGLWRRVRLIPFEREFNDSNSDKELLQNLKTEAQGIFAWAVRGCLLWQQDGLAMPRKVTQATDSYRAENDPVGRFISEWCILHPAARTSSAELFACYQSWCEESGEKPIDQRRFAQRLEAQGCSKVKIGHASARGWEGIRLQEKPVSAPSDADRRTLADANSHCSDDRKRVV
jgi:putative DNA primase/helicase